MLIKHVIHLRILYFSLSPLADPVLLDDEKLVKLAKVVYKQEVEAAKYCKCNSEIEHSNSFRETKVCYNTVLGLLDSVKQLKKEYEDGDENLSSIANDIFSFVVYAVNNALQFLSNYSLRKHYLDKISENAKALIRALKEIDPNNVTNVQRLAKDAIIFRNAILEMVYNKIIEASGRGRITVNQVSKALGATGMAVLIFTAAIALWDVYTSDNKLQTAARDTLQFIGAAGGGTLGEYAATALATGLLGAAASPVFVVAAGIVGGIAGAYILGKFAAHLVDEVFSWGDTDNITHLNDQIHFHQCCVAPAPNGNVLSRPIDRHDEL
ncbi:hypothetical protein FEM48_Zijuj01G0224100 [Ziziphus jujuba var. spinosa]|uniref:Uncharacterized protein n=1 Tax=Ziziphus jujuba var. spinosa TaxID=714518 RepID=A0A978W3W8_ZIZJJ|nr:hypothetical protein FEM48_Zijuj01G0224100 [Ziziphus jujuba var. spinosa]